MDHKTLRGKKFLASMSLCVSLGVSLMALVLSCANARAETGLSDLKVQTPYRLSVFAHVRGARSLAPAHEIATVFVGTRAKSLYAIREGKVHVLSASLRVPNGIVWRAPYLYVAEQHRVSRYRFDKFQSRLPAGEVLFDGLPNKKHHGWRVAAIGADDRLYLAVGAPCNICTPKGLEGTIVRLPLTGGAPEIYARGVRNSVGMDFRPQSGVLFFTDNGADFMGDNSPLEELNRAPRKGMFFGYPFFGGARERTRQFETRPLPQESTFPVATFPAHNAPLGVHFYRGEKIEDLKGDAFVALHGSWNRSVPDGYRVIRLHFEHGNPAPSRQSVFIDGFLHLEGGRGRPVDVTTHWDGSLLVSDDARGLVYQIQ